MGEQSPRSSYKYLYKVGNRIKNIGCTTDLTRREQELRSKAPNGRIVKVGRRTTATAARRWARAKR